jgi:ABC-type transport system involved in multi-copper enzyme maturation permease subunit
MTVFPVIARELRASARQPFTYYLRVVGVTALLLASLLFGLHYGFEASLGRQLFGALHCTLFGAIWVLVPMLTADCISRERREGTLGLLFLTPLKGTDIVVAKGLVHGLRALTLSLAVVPVLTLPFLMGGVSWKEAAFSVVVNANAMCWALAAGLLASAWSKAWMRALLGAATLAIAFFLLLVTGAGWFLLTTSSFGPAGLIEISWDRSLSAGLLLLANATDGWLIYGRWGLLRQMTLALGETTVVSLLLLVVAVLAAGAKIRHAWQEEPPSQRQVWLERTFCTPVLWLSFFHRWMRWKLERNPIGWLEQRTWSGRLVTWGWLAVLISIYSFVFTDRQFLNAVGMHATLAWLLTGTMAMSAAGSFRRERDTGVLELLLVSPLGESQILSGRLGGLWSQFLPAAGLLLSVWAYCSSFLPNGGDVGTGVFFLTSFLSVPVFGLYFSLRCRKFITAFLATVAVGLLVPLILPPALGALRFIILNFILNSRPDSSLEPLTSSSAALCQLILAVLCWDRLLLRLKQRAFPLERTE